MRGLISQKNAMLPSTARLQVLAAVWVLLVLASCFKPDSGQDGGVQSADRFAATGGKGSGGAPVTGGSGGHSAAGGAGGVGGETTGAGGESGSGGGTGGLEGVDAGSGGRPVRDAAMHYDTESSAIDGGAVACDDIKSPGRLAVYYYSTSETPSQSIQLYFDVVNFTALSARLSEVTVRYWFTDEGAGSPNVVDQFYVPLPTNTKFIPVNPPRKGADTVLEISYSPSKDAGASFVETRNFNLAFHKDNYAGVFDLSNDYSYDATLTKSWGRNPKITAYVNGVLAWGCEPPP